MRFNTKHTEDERGRKWRVLTAEGERLASAVRILVPCETVEEAVNGEPKYHFQ